MAALSQADIDYYHKGAEENRTFWARLGVQPSVGGARVLDVGCGVGRLCVDLARAGAASVVGLDTDARQIAFAAEYVRQQHPELAGIVEFRDVAVGEYRGESFDLIISKDSFEHIMDLPGVLREMKRCLAPGGKVYAGFGPLYRSPFGHHGRIITFLPSRRFPWGHLLEKEDRIVARMNRRRALGEAIFCYQDGPIGSIRDLGLNQYSLADYRRILAESGFKVARFRVNQSTRLFSKICSVLRRIPPLEEYFTHNIYCVLENSA